MIGSDPLILPVNDYINFDLTGAALALGYSALSYIATAARPRIGRGPGGRGGSDVGPSMAFLAKNRYSVFSHMRAEREGFEVQNPCGNLLLAPKPLPDG